MFRIVDKPEDLRNSELKTWYKHQRGRTPVRVRGQLWGFIMYQPHLRCIIYTTPRTPRHFLIKKQAFGISESIMPRLKASKVEFIFVRYQGRKLTWYIAPIEAFIEGEPWVDPQNLADNQLLVKAKDMIAIEEG